MIKSFTNVSGSGYHLHLIVTNAGAEKNAFIVDEHISGTNAGCISLFEHFPVVWMIYTPDVMVFYAPTINSYKRFVSSKTVPTTIAWGYDNRTVSFRVISKDQSLRIECRIPGADCNIHLAYAASLALG